MSAPKKTTKVVRPAAAAAAAAASAPPATAGNVLRVIDDSDSDGGPNPHRLAQWMDLRLLIAEYTRDGNPDPVLAAQSYLSNWKRKCARWDRKHAVARPPAAAAAAAAAELPPIAEPESPTSPSPCASPAASSSESDDDDTSESDSDVKTVAPAAAPAPASASAPVPLRRTRVVPMRDTDVTTVATADESPTPFALAVEQEAVRPALPKPAVAAYRSAAAAATAVAMEADEDGSKSGDDDDDDDLELEPGFDDLTARMSNDAKLALAALETHASCKRVSQSKLVKAATAALDARRLRGQRLRKLATLDPTFRVDVLNTRYVNIERAHGLDEELASSGFSCVRTQQRALSVLVIDYLLPQTTDDPILNSKEKHKVETLRAVTDATHKLLEASEHSSLVHVATGINNCATVADGLAVKQAMSLVRDVFQGNTDVPLTRTDESPEPVVMLDRHALLDLLTNFASEVTSLSLTAVLDSMTFLVNENDLRRQVLTTGEFLQLIRATKPAPAATAAGADDDERFVDAIRRVNLSKSSKLRKFASLTESIKPIMERMLAKAKHAAMIAAGVPSPAETQEELESMLESYFDRQLALRANKMGCLAAYIGLQAATQHDFRFIYGASGIAVDSKKSSLAAPGHIAISNSFLSSFAFDGNEEAGEDKVAKTVAVSGSKRKSPSPSSPAAASAAAALAPASASAVAVRPRGKPPTLSSSDTETDEDIPQEPKSKKAKLSVPLWKAKITALQALYDSVNNTNLDVRIPLDVTCIECHKDASNVRDKRLYTCSACLSATVCRMCAACHWGVRDCHLVATSDDKKVVKLRKLWFEQTSDKLVLDSPPITALKNKAKAAKRAAIKRAAVKQAAAAAAPVAPTPVVAAAPAAAAAAASSSSSPSPAASSSPTSADADSDERQICIECKSVFENWGHDCMGDGCNECGKCINCCNYCAMEGCNAESGCEVCHNLEFCTQCCDHAE